MARTPRTSQDSFHKCQILVFGAETGQPAVEAARKKGVSNKAKLQPNLGNKAVNGHKAETSRRKISKIGKIKSNLKSNQDKINPKIRLHLNEFRN